MNNKSDNAIAAKLYFDRKFLLVLHDKTIKTNAHPVIPIPHCRGKIYNRLINFNPSNFATDGVSVCKGSQNSIIDEVILNADSKVKIWNDSVQCKTLSALRRLNEFNIAGRVKKNFRNGYSRSN